MCRKQNILFPGPPAWPVGAAFIPDIALPKSLVLERWMVLWGLSLERKVTRSTTCRKKSWSIWWPEGRFWETFSALTIPFSFSSEPWRLNSFLPILPCNQTGLCDCFFLVTRVRNTSKVKNLIAGARVFWCSLPWHREEAWCSNDRARSSEWGWQSPVGKCFCRLSRLLVDFGWGGAKLFFSLSAPGFIVRNKLLC